MKNIICLGLMILLSQGLAFSYINSLDMTDETYMRNQDYSSETIRLINMQKYTPTVNRDEKNTVGKTCKSVWQKINAYYDPAFDNGTFGNNNIPFTNRWDEI